MITRAQMRRQLRAQGGIMNAVPRQGYFLGKIVKGIGKGLGKVVDVAKQVVKSPIGKAALLGLGASFIGPKIMSGGLGNLFKSGLGSFASQLGPQATSGSGLLGLLGKGKTAFANLGTGAKLAGGAGLLSYFMSKGASEDEAKQLASDVYRGKGIGFDQIRADLNKYKSGELNQQEMFDKNYRFLTPRNFVAAEGGRARLQEGSNPGPMGNPAIMEKIENMREYRIMNPDEEDVADYLTYYKKKKKQDDEIKQMLKKKKTKKVKKAMGGIMDMPTGKMRRNKAGVMERDYRDEGGFVPVGVKEKADDVPAMLSKNEFVMTADAVRGAGGGNIKKGAQRMYDLMKKNEGKVA
jgi:hypothetical protein